MLIIYNQSNWGTVNSTLRERIPFIFQQIFLWCICLWHLFMLVSNYYVFKPDVTIFARYYLMVLNIATPFSSHMTELKSRKLHSHAQSHVRSGVWVKAELLGLPVFLLKITHASAVDAQDPLFHWGFCPAKYSEIQQSSLFSSFLLSLLILV